jgi:DNA-binding NtrC family response regulator
MAKILIVEDDAPLRKMASAYLGDEGHEVSVAADEDSGLAALNSFAPEIVITDLMLESGSGINILKEARAKPEPPEVILVTAHATSHTAAQAMQEGAYEYLTKPYSLEEIGNIVKRILDRRELVGRTGAVAQPVGDRGGIIADSAKMQHVLELTDDVISSTTSILLRGESGTGKEIVARYIHANSPRKDHAFVAVNCGAIPESLLASALFGHEQGAFTGANSRKIGAFEGADQGTLLLDEIGDVSLSTQVHLLRVLETREITRVGGNESIPIDVRLIAATHQNLEAMIRSKSFREDLYYRLNVYPITIPPLRERRDDIPALTDFFLRQWGSDAGRVEENAMRMLMEYTWPGNVRELRNVSENLMIRAKGGMITLDLLRSVLPESPLQSTDNQGQETLHELESRRICEALEATNGNKTEAARLLGISRRRMYSRLKILGIQ